MISRKGLFIYIAASISLIFFAWQGVTIFTLGYRVEDMAELVRKEEIKRQQLIREYGFVANHYEIDRRASEYLKMRVPSQRNIRTVGVSRERLYADDPPRRIPLVSYIKEVLLISDAEARQ